MGILNITPDSFSDGGRFPSVAAAVDAAGRMVEAGAAVIDIGGESTRPGASAVSAAEEIDRVLPVIEGVRPFDAVVSVDTSKAAVAEAAIAAGAGMVNDVLAARAPGMLEVLARSRVAVCLMHMRGEPRTMQVRPEYEDVVREVAAFLAERASACRAAGVARERLMLDPGIGFGKTVPHNLELLRNLPALSCDGLPILVGASRKNTIGQLTGKPPAGRLAGSIGAAVFAVTRGAAMVRVHDVEETVDALEVVRAIESGSQWRPGGAGCRRA
ncbi:MAG: dihydropteroate synthase [Gammaproteobacteria bacterium]|nr:dihydropteroate synthase [Gammaproteobacteria bacterium]MYE81717.1 dihydropteroate synthase [Gammaproteobacteria bacterium]